MKSPGALAVTWRQGSTPGLKSRMPADSVSGVTMSPHPANARIPTTSWTLIKRLHRGGDADSARAALAILCENYWYPLYAFARRSGSAPADAEDATQSFFTAIIGKDLFTAADPAAGKLRTFLLTAFTRHLRDLRDLRGAIKRGGGAEHLPLDLLTAEDSYTREPTATGTPDETFDRAWAATILDLATRALATAEHAAGRGDHFAALEALITPDTDTTGAYTEAAARLAISEPAARKAVERLRARYRDILRHAIADTLHDPDPAQIENELRSLRAALRR